ncbi:hypothetical protein N0V82_001562 [Gnomoniopsis sp. IMI 355080]|nr:hypothetical protein N0V82_001562 [Gnomoniopsis sp. IMI 355080]
MRIACLQFAPQVGEVDNNLNRADAVLAKANQDDVDSLDLLVLPELAFSGHNFGSSDEIAPYLEPSGSGISSLWARTIALKHNTNVLIGYPEQIDASGSSRAGPKQYNSAILVNGDGETVANYRKTFLHPLDESWAREGREFFGDRVPGLGTIAIGIGGDINPYRLEAPWHAFEFAFHILDVQADLAIVNMAWFTNEECAQFTQFPNEPDMETLAYWARRLEPIIRDESREELIIVFCNRTGVEDQLTVYAGTSAVIGIHQGEVKVYGLLGRGVKELLIVDTDDPPYANLTIRKDGVHLSPLEYELKTSEHSDGAESLLFKPSPIHPGRRTPTKCFPGAAHSKATPKSLPTEVYRLPPNPTIVNTLATGCQDSISSNDSSPTSTSTRPQLSTETSCTSIVQVEDLDAINCSSSSTGRILGGSVEIMFGDDQDAVEEDLGQLSSTSPSGSPLGPHSPAVSQEQQQLGVARAPPTFDQSPASAELPRLGESSPGPQHVPTLRERYADIGQSCRVVGLDQGLIERALDFYLGSKSVDIRDRIFAIDAHRPRAGNLTDDEPSAYADFAASSSLSDRSHSSSSSAPSTRSVAAHHNTDAARIDKEAGESRTVLWQEDSQIVGQHLRGRKSKEGFRGRRRSRDTSPNNDRRGSGADPSTGSKHLSDSTDPDDDVHNRNASRHQTSRGQYGSTDGRISPSRFLGRNGDTIRSVRDPSLGPPSDSEDEIIAEITFRRPACRNCGSNNCGSRGANRPQAQNIGSNGSGTASDQQEDMVPELSKSMPLSPSSADSEKTPTMNKTQAPHSDPVRLALQTKSEELDELRRPNLSRVSIRTLSSYEPSPVTPPPRHFEPKTPKAMVFNSDFAPISIDPVSNLKFDTVDVSLDDIISMSVERPRAPV